VSAFSRFAPDQRLAATANSGGRLIDLSPAVQAGRGMADTGDMEGAAALSPDLVLVLPPDERRRAIAELAARGPRPIMFDSVPRSVGPSPTAPLAATIVRYAVYRTVAAATWYVAFAVAIGLLVAALAAR
jgi:hypothetical protein